MTTSLRMHRVARAVTLSHVVGTFGARMLVIALAFVSTALVSRLLGPAGRGEYAVATTLTALGAQLATFGLHASNTYTASRDPALLPPLLANSLVASLAGGVLAAVVVAVCLLRWPELVGLHGWPLTLAVVTVPFALAYQLTHSLLLGVHDVDAYNRVDVGRTALGVVLVGGVALVGMARVTSLLVCALAAAMASAAWTVARLRRRAAGRIAPSAPLFRATLRYGAMAYGAALLLYLAQRADVLIVTGLAGVEQAGYYAAAVSIASLVALGPTVVGTLLFPRLAAVADPTARWGLTRPVVVAVALGATLVGLVVALLAPVVVRLLFGAAFLPAVAPLRWLLLGSVVLATNSILMNYFAAMGMPPVTVLAPAAALVVVVVLDLLLVPTAGTVGAAMASAAASVTMLVASIGQLASARRERRP